MVAPVSWITRLPRRQQRRLIALSACLLGVAVCLALLGQLANPLFAAGEQQQPAPDTAEPGALRLETIPLPITGLEGVTDMAWGDMNGDGYLDLVVARGSGISNSLYLNYRGLGFVAVWHGGTEDTTAVALGDIEGDGDLDIAFGNYGQPNRIFLNNGVLAGAANQPDAEYTSLQIVDSGWLDTQSDKTQDLLWADMNGDGYLDLIVGNGDREAQAGSANRIYVNNCSGGLDTGPAWSGADTHRTLRVDVADMNGDGLLELAEGNFVTQGEEDTVGFTAVIQFQLSGTFESGACHNSGSLTGTPVWTGGNFGVRDLAWGDVNADGFPELAVVDDTIEGDLLEDVIDGVSGDVFTLLPPAEASAAEDVAGELSESALLLRSANGVFANSAGSLEGNTLDGSSDSTPGWRPATQSQGRSVAWGDADGDGDLDLFIGSSSDAREQVYLNANGVLQGSQPAWESDVFGRAQNADWIDFDSDGDRDLAVQYSGGVYLYINHASSLSDEAQSIDGPGGASMDRLDGIYLRSTSFERYFSGSRAVEFRARLEPAIARAIDTQRRYDLTQSIAWGDVDNDNDLDLVAGNLSYSLEPPGGGSPANDSGRPNRLYLNEGGEFKAGVLSFGNSSTSAVAWGDANGDGYLDLAVGNLGGEAGERNLVYFNTRNVEGASWFDDAAAVELPVQDRTLDVAWADVDQDGDLDLAVANEGELPDILYLNENGTFALEDGRFYLFGRPLEADVAEDDAQDAPVSPEEQVARACAAATCTRSTSLAWGDVDGDGDLDLAVGNLGERNRLYYNENGVISDTAVQLFGGSEATWGVAWGDMNGDGLLDLAVGNAGQTIQVYLNVGGQLDTTPAWESLDLDDTRDVAWGDVDGDGDLDLAVANAGGQNNAAAEPNKVYLNENGMLQTAADRPWQTARNQVSYSVAWGDADGDGDLDLAFGNGSGTRFRETDASNLIIRNEQFVAGSGPGIAIQPANGNNVSDATILASGVQPVDGSIVLPDFAAGETVRVDYTLTHPDSGPAAAILAFYSTDGGATWNRAMPLPGTPTANLASTIGCNRHSFAWNTAAAAELSGAVSGVLFRLEVPDPNATLAPDATPPAAQDVTPTVVQSPQVPAVSSPVVTAVGVNRTDHSLATANLFALPGVREDGTVRISYVLTDPAERPVPAVRGFFSLNGGSPGTWIEATPTAATQTTNLSTRAGCNRHEFVWDTYASGLFGQSDSIVFRLEAYGVIPADERAVPATFLYVNEAARPAQRPLQATTTFPFRVRNRQIRVFEATQDGQQPVSGAFVYRLPSGGEQAGVLTDQRGMQFRTDVNGYLQGAHVLLPGDQLVALALVDTTDTITFTNKARLFHTSAAPNPAGLDMQRVGSEPRVNLLVTADNPLLLFDLDVALEWDASEDVAFLQELERSFQNASELLYDVTNGQAALGLVNVFHARQGRSSAGWLEADVQILANNTMRPSASYGGVVTVPLSDTITRTVGAETVTEVVPAVYVPQGKIRMGPSWDPFGESTADLSEDWWRAFAHELAHYLLFLPDNYLGFKGEDADALGRVNCRNSFMTSTYDPTYSEFLIRSQWEDDEQCLLSLANNTTQRSDWETIRTFYPMLRAPDATGVPLSDGPAVLPLDVLDLISWGPVDGRETLPTRTFDVRNADDERWRLPSAQGFLIQTQGTPNEPTDDVLVMLGSPTGGGDRLRVRGAFPQDQLCLVDNSGNSTGTVFGGCIERLQRTNTKINVASPADGLPAWQPDVKVQKSGVTGAAVTVRTPQLPADERLRVQLFPQHYFSLACFTGLAPTAVLEPAAGDQATSDGMQAYAATLAMRLPASDVVARVWVEQERDGVWRPDYSRQAITHLQLPLLFYASYMPVLTNEEAGLDVALAAPDAVQMPVTNRCVPPVSTQFIGYWPVFVQRPDITAFGGPNAGLLGGPSAGLLGGPNAGLLGGPNAGLLGGPNAGLLGGPNAGLLGGPNAGLLGGPNAGLLGGPNAGLLGGPNAGLLGGPNAGLLGGPNAGLLGGPNAGLLGGPNAGLLGGPNAGLLGGPNAGLLGGPNAGLLGGPNAGLLGGPNAGLLGGPNAGLLGGPNAGLLGGPNAGLLGGPNAGLLGGPNAGLLGGADRNNFGAPVWSADAQVVIYSKEGFFEDNGVTRLQAVGSVGHPWLTLVGDAYHVTLDPDARTQPRAIAYTYLQRDVPAGYEYTLRMYFRADGTTAWERLEDSEQFVDNLIVADLRPEDGTYAVMATIDMPALEAGWNLVAYTVPVDRSPEAYLASVWEVASAICEVELDHATGAVVRPPAVVNGRVAGGARCFNTAAGSAPDDAFRLDFGDLFWIYVTEPAALQYETPVIGPDGNLR